MKAMCEFFGVSRAAYYTWLKRLEKPDKDALRMALVQEAWKKSRKTYGYRRIGLWIRQHKGIVINHKAVLRLMNKLNIQSVARKRKPYKKMSQLDSYHRYDNLLDRTFTADRPNQKWVTDITYIRTTQGWAPINHQGFARWLHRCT
ncbi:MAG: IS3 family transposase [Anaerolineales bacterium]|nr:IS3 family transposase [Anaerolineales bacterium]